MPRPFRGRIVDGKFVRDPRGNLRVTEDALGAKICTLHRCHIWECQQRNHPAPRQTHAVKVVRRSKNQITLRFSSTPEGRAASRKLLHGMGITSLARVETCDIATLPPRRMTDEKAV
jgi:hypothetical protein